MPLRGDAIISGDFAIKIGIDEAGRGPLAGPVMAAAVWFDESQIPPDLLVRIDDSKKIKAAARQEIASSLWQLMRQPHPMICGAVAAASVHEIDRLNILNATFLAMERAVKRLLCQPAMAVLCRQHKLHLMIDGNQIPKIWRLHQEKISAQAIIGGDGSVKQIAAASILAKTVRDLAMVKLHQRYPDYGFARHAGYGTAKHRAAMAQFGLTPHHRPLFCRVKNISFSPKIWQ